MAIRIANNDFLIVDPSPSFTGNRRTAASLRFRLEAPTADGFWRGRAMNIGPFYVQVFGQQPADVPEVSLIVGVSLGASWQDDRNVVVKARPGVTNHLALVYDADDPARQFVGINGVKTSFTGADAALPSRDSGLYFGDLWEDPLSAFSVEGLYLCAGDALDDAELDGLARDDQATIETVAARATGTLRYPLAWTPGGAVVDEGLEGIGTKSLDPARPLRTWRGRPGGEYGAATPYVDLARFGEPTVMASGRVIDVPVLLGVDDPKPGIIADRDPSKSPTFRINGGPPIAPARIFATGGRHDGLACSLPEGAAVQPGDVVTWSAPAGMVLTDAGQTAEVVDAPVRNRSGATTHDPAKEAQPLRVGVNMTAPGPDYYAPYRLQRNSRYNISDDYDRHEGEGYRADGSRANPGSGMLVHMQPLNTSLDRVGYPSRFGLWMLAWRDWGVRGDNGESACEFALHSEVEASNFRLVPAYSSDEVQPDGSIKRVRAFECFRDARPAKLAAAIDATTTTIPVESIWMRGLPAPERWLTDARLDLDGESIIVRDVDRAANPPLLLNCVRGADGTAKAHGAGAEGSLMALSPGGWAYLKVDAANGVGPIRYTDLAILPPGEWDVPNPPAPAPWVEVGPLETSREFKRFAAGGLGVIRFMDSLYDSAFGMTRIQEADQIRSADDQTWRGSKNAPKAALVSIKNATFGPNSFCYFLHPGHNHQTYPVELLAPLAAVAAGTRQTISVRGTAANPLLKGTRLLVGAERIRILSGSGSSWLVERGTDGTTPTAHAAGTIQAGWRLPLPSSGAAPDAILGEFATEAPHGLSTFYPFSWSIPDDCNQTARRSLKLAASVDPAALTFAVTPADPGDWDYIHPGLSMRLGDESLLIASANRAAGTVTVENRPSGRAQSSGTPITTYSNRVLCESEDGTRRRWQTCLTEAYTLRVTGPSTFLAVSPGVDGVFKVVGTQTIDPPGKLLATEPGPAFPPEFAATVAGESGGWFWLNVPPCSSDAHVLEQARRVRDHFPAGRKVIVETANEVWNFFFPYFGPFEEYARLAGLGSVVEAWVVESGRRFELVRSVFAEAGREAEVLHCLPWQHGSAAAALQAARKLGVNVDVTGGAPYIRVHCDANSIAAWNAASDAEACDLWTFSLARDAAPGSIRWRLENDRAAVEAHVAATGRQLVQVHYEGGLETAIPEAPASGAVNPAIDQSTARNRDIRNHPNWYFTERDIYHLIQRQGGSLGIAVFDNVQDVWRNSNDAPADHLWGMASHWGQKPGRGDGRDGGFDNRLNIYRRGVPESADLVTSVEGTKDSVRWQAMIDHNRRFFSGVDLEDPGLGNPGGGGPPPDGNGGEPSPSPRSHRARKFVARRRF